MTPTRRIVFCFAALGLLAGIAACAAWLAPVELRVWLLLRNTLVLATWTCAIALPLGTVLAVLLTRTDVPGRFVAGVLLVAMLFVPLYLYAAAWQAGFGKLGWYGADARGITTPLLDGWRAVVWIQAMAVTPWVALIVGVGLRLVEPELEEDALLYFSAWQVFARVTSRRAAASIGVAGLWIFVSTAGEMTVTDMYGIRTYAEELYTNFSLGQIDIVGGGAPPGDVGSSADRVVGSEIFASIVAVAGLVLAATVVAVFVAPPHEETSVRPPPVFRLKSWRWPWALLLAIVMAAIVGVPIANLCIAAGMEVQTIGGHRTRTWALGKALHMVAGAPGRYGSEFGWSTLIGTASATLAFVMALPLAWQARRGGRRAVPAIAVTAFCLAIVGPITGLGVMWLLNREESMLLVWLYDRTLLAPVLATTVRALPPTLLVCWYALRGIARDSLESAATEGAGGWTRFWRVAAPQRAAALAAAWLVAFILATGDLAASILVLPPGVETIQRRVFGLLHYGVDDQVAGICLLIVFGTAGLSGAVVQLLRLAQRRRGRGPHWRNS